jgi:hypothetical protein
MSHEDQKRERFETRPKCLQQTSEGRAAPERSEAGPGPTSRPPKTGAGAFRPPEWRGCPTDLQKTGGCVSPYHVVRPPGLTPARAGATRAEDAVTANALGVEVARSAIVLADAPPIIDGAEARTAALVGLGLAAVLQMGHTTGTGRRVARFVWPTRGHARIAAALGAARALADPVKTDPALAASGALGLAASLQMADTRLGKTRKRRC